jgi:WD40 repeat protein
MYVCVCVVVGGKQGRVCIFSAPRDPSPITEEEEEEGGGGRGKRASGVLLSFQGHRGRGHRLDIFNRAGGRGRGMSSLPRWHYKANARGPMTNPTVFNVMSVMCLCEGWVCDVRWLPVGGPCLLLVSGGNDGLLKLWDVNKTTHSKASGHMPKLLQALDVSYMGHRPSAH